MGGGTPPELSGGPALHILCVLVMQRRNEAEIGDFAGELGDFE
jgi:hypothetical protein